MTRSRSRLTQTDVRRMALKLPEVTESSHMGTPDFRVRNKIFATLPPKMPTRLVLKVAPAELDAMTSADPLTFKDVWGGRWVGVDLTRVSRGEVEALLEDAWKRVAPKAILRPRPRSSGG